MDTLDSINHQTCVCSNHTSLPMHGTSKFIKEPIPTYEQMQQLHQEFDPDLLLRSEIQVLYINCIISWIYARLYQYITPYTDPTINKKVGPRGQPFDWEFHHAERAFIENRISMMDMDATYLTQMRGVNQLMDLKKRPIVLVKYQLRLPNSSTNREVIRKVLQEMPHGFSAVISSCQQIIGTTAACELHLYEVVPTSTGIFEAVKTSCVKQPHDTIKDAYIDFSGTSFMYACCNKEEKHTITSLFGSLFADVKRLSIVEHATDVTHQLMEAEEDASLTATSFKTTTASSLPDLMASFKIFDLD